MGAREQATLEWLVSAMGPEGMLMYLLVNGITG